ncbi:hypothetical protein PR202_gb28671 [Eleusine coracana subsp. coracana]|uniref:RING-type domain-containing protein n=1 Tax=Eleusine coracana subsp. coracana TaxID=191504 RepID=A0AAV5FXJ9_ELECO|nr:hypothetical protein PR202_gb28671 [Eleusine coracana subsp. coracana]
MTLPTGDRLCIVSASLLVAGGGGQHPVNVWAESNDGETRPIATLTPDDPIAAVAVTLDGEFVLRHDAADATVRLLCQIHYADGVADDAPPAARLVEPTVIDGVELEPLDDDDDYPEAELSDDDDDDDDMVHFHVLDLGPPPPRDAEEEGEYEPVVEYDVPSEEDDAERYDSDNGEEDDDADEPLPGKSTNSEVNGEGSSSTPPLVPAPAGTVVPDGYFLGRPARYAAVENTAGFMRVAGGGAHDDDEEDGNNKEIVVLYRYTRFSRTWSGRRGVEPCRRTKLHRLRFAVPRAGDVAAGSLAWAGAALGPLVYPALFRRQLQELWSTLLSPAMSAVPPGAARVQVIVDVGILRREDYTEERMDHMRGAMEAKMREEWPEYCHVGMELQLPELVPDGDDTRTAKRRKVADEEETTEEECAVCFDRLERGLAAWPGCRHVFHGTCVEKTLAGSEMCPLCRTKLSDQRVG